MAKGPSFLLEKAFVDAIVCGVAECFASVEQELVCLFESLEEQNLSTSSRRAHALLSRDRARVICQPLGAK